MVDVDARRPGLRRVGPLLLAGPVRRNRPFVAGAMALQNLLGLIRIMGPDDNHHSLAENFQGQSWRR